MKKLTEKKITEYCKKELFNKKSIYEFIDDPKRVKKYKRYENLLFASGLGALIGIFIILLLHNSYFILIPILSFVPLFITSVKLRRYFKETESLRNETYEYFLSQKLVTHLKMALKISKKKIAKYEVKCIKRTDKSTTLSFSAFFGVLLPIASICYGIFNFLNNGAVINEKILVPVIIFCASIIWLLFRSIYILIVDSEINSYKRLVELLSENNYN